MIERLLFGLIMALTLVHTGLAIIAQDVTAAGLTVVAGFAWLTLEARQNNAFTGLFFVYFVALAGIGVLQAIPVPIMILALLGALAAWDLSRLRSRLAEANAEMTPVLEQEHLRKLAITLAVGGSLALMPLIAVIPINFLLLAIMTLLVLYVLRRAIRQLRGPEAT